MKEEFAASCPVRRLINGEQVGLPGHKPGGYRGWPGCLHRGVYGGSSANRPGVGDIHIVQTGCGHLVEILLDIRRADRAGSHPIGAIPFWIHKSLVDVDTAQLCLAHWPTGSHLAIAACSLAFSLQGSGRLVSGQNCGFGIGDSGYRLFGRGSRPTCRRCQHDQHNDHDIAAV